MLDLIVTYNLFKETANYDQIEQEIESILRQKKHAESHYNIILAISAVRVTKTLIERIRERFRQEHIIYNTFFIGNHRHTEEGDYAFVSPVQVTFNKTCQLIVDKFGLPKAGFCYVSSGILFPNPKENPILFRAIKKALTHQYGIIQFQVDIDQGYEYLGHGYKVKSDTADPNRHARERDPSVLDFSKDYIIPVGNSANWHSGIFHSSLYENFDSRIMSDVFGRSHMEGSHSYICASIKKNFLLLGDSQLRHRTQGRGSLSYPHQVWINGMSWDLFNTYYEEGKKHGLGFLPGAMCSNPRDKVIYPHDPKKFTKNHLCKNSELKKYVRKVFYSCDEELIYSKIPSKLLLPLSAMAFLAHRHSPGDLLSSTNEKN